LCAGVLEVEEVGPGDGVSRGSGSSEEKSSLDKSVGGEKKREGNIDNSVEDIRSSKGSRRTTSLLNLFIPLSQGMWVGLCAAYSVDLRTMCRFFPNLWLFLAVFFSDSRKFDVFCYRHHEIGLILISVVLQKNYYFSVKV